MSLVSCSIIYFIFYIIFLSHVFPFKHTNNISQDYFPTMNGSQEWLVPGYMIWNHLYYYTKKVSIYLTHTNRSYKYIIQLWYFHLIILKIWSGGYINGFPWEIVHDKYTRTILDACGGATCNQTFPPRVGGLYNWKKSSRGKECHSQGSIVSQNYSKTKTIFH